MPRLYGRNSTATNFDLLRYRTAQESNHDKDFRSPLASLTPITEVISVGHGIAGFTPMSPSFAQGASRVSQESTFELTWVNNGFWFRAGNTSVRIFRSSRSRKGKSGAPGEIRTPDLLLRRQSLYPTELRARCIQSTWQSVGHQLVRKRLVGQFQLSQLVILGKGNPSLCEGSRRRTVYLRRQRPHPVVSS